MPDTLSAEFPDNRLLNPHDERIGSSLGSPLSWFALHTTAGPRDGQYLSVRYTERLAEAGIEPSVGSVGDPYDNALAETINGLYKTVPVHRQGPWRNMQDLEMATLGWVDWFNHRRLLGPIGNIPPEEAKENFYAQRDVLDMVA
jgi:transposase InsO family protein